MSGLLVTEPSICIPRVEPDATAQGIKAVFDKIFGAGVVERVDMVRWRGDDTRGLRRAFVHLTAWPGDARSAGIRKRLLDWKEIKVMHDEPWFWRCARSRVAKPEWRGRPRRGMGLDPAFAAQAAREACL